MSPVSYCKKIVRSFFEKFGLDVRRVRPKSRLGSPKYSNFNEEEIVRDLVEALSVKRRFCVDIGAADGVSMSNSYTLFQSGWHGLISVRKHSWFKDESAGAQRQADKIG